MELNKYYAGIGSRSTPKTTLNLMQKLAKKLGDKGYVLRSGGAIGADKAFENGAVEKEIYRPNNATYKAIQLASELHPAWHNCSDYVKKLHGRNAQIILGRELDSPVDFVIAWTPGAMLKGGTALGIRIANKYNIPVFNLASDDALKKLKEFVRSGN